MHVIKDAEGVFTEITGHLPIEIGTGTEAVRYPHSILTAWSSAELAALDIYPVVLAAVPDGATSAGYSFKQDEEGCVLQVHTLIDSTAGLTELDYEAAIQELIDTTAQERSYSSGVNAVSYANCGNAKWEAEADAFKAWRTSVWAFAYEQFDLVQSGQRPQPTVAEFLAEIAPIDWGVA